MARPGGDDSGAADDEIASEGSAAATTADTVTDGQSLDPEPAVRGRWAPLGEPGVGGRLTAVAIDPWNPDRVLVGGDLLGIAHSDDGGRSWQRSSGLLSLETAQFTFSPDRTDEVWVGSMSGPHRSTDGGVTWEPSRSGFPAVEAFYYSAPVEVVVFDNAVPDRLLAFGGSQREWESLGEPAWGAVWESLDRGTTWTRLSTIAGGANIVSAIQREDGTLLAAALEQGVQRSIDGGVTWEPASDGLPHGNVRDLAVIPGSDTVLAALAEGQLVDGEHLSGGVYRSDDAGITWRPSSEGLSLRRDTRAELTSRYHAIEVSDVDPDTIWTADLAFGLETILRSDDGGQTWQVELAGDGDDGPVTAYSSPVTAEVLVADLDAAELRFVAQSEYVLRRTPDGDWADATSVRKGEEFAGTGFSGLVSTDVTFDPAKPGVLALSALDGGQYIRSENSGATWSRPLTGWDQWGGAQSMTISGDRIYVLLGQFGVFNGIAESADGGTTWTFAAGAENGLPERFDNVTSIGDIVALADAPRRVIATIDGAVHSSNDGGETWLRTLEGSYESLAVGLGDQVYVADAEGVYELSGDADSVTELGSSPSGTDTITVDPTSGFIYAVQWGLDDNTTGSINRWDGAGWSQVCLDVPSCGTGLDRYAADIAVDPDDSDHLIVATNDLPFHDVIGSQGVLRSTDGGASWAPINDGLPVLRVGVVEFDPHRSGHLVIGTMGGGFYEMTLPD